MASEFTKSNVRRWMRDQVEEYGNATAFAEGAADHFGQADEGGPLDDPDHWIWELALEASEQAEETEDA